MEWRDEEEYVVGEEEAVWLIKLVLPFFNEFLSKLRSLFSGDPATTMKVEQVNYFFSLLLLPSHPMVYVSIFYISRNTHYSVERTKYYY